MFLIFDTETTGIPDFRLPADAPGQPRMASIAAALVDESGGVVESFYELVRPDGWDDDVIARSAAAFAINRLTIERLRDEGKPVVDVLGMYDVLVDKCVGIAAYSIPFDQKIIRAEQRRAGRPDRYGERPTFCVMQGVKPLLGVKKVMKLTEAINAVFGETLPDAHDAHVDLRATVRLFLEMKARGIVEWTPQTPRDEDT